MEKLIRDMSEMNDIAKEVLDSTFRTALRVHPSRATVLGLSGGLGAGKTTFTQFFAKALGIIGSVPSPTFVIARFYDIPEHGPFRRLIHIDAYRIESEDELGPLGWRALLADPANLILVEWPEHMKGQFPADAAKLAFRVVDESTRHLTYEEGAN